MLDLEEEEEKKKDNIKKATSTEGIGNRWRGNVTRNCETELNE